jgi:hypothetical protein
MLRVRFIRWRPSSVGHNFTRRQQSTIEERFTNDVTAARESGLTLSTPLGNLLASVGVLGFLCTYGYHIAKPVYDAYQHDDADDDDADNATGDTGDGAGDAEE